MKKMYFTMTFMLFVISASSQLSWIRLPDYPGQGKLAVASMSINGKGYIGLGHDQSGNGSSEWFEYNPGTNSWTQKASLPSLGRWSVVSFTIGNIGYICTGAINGSLTNETWAYDPGSDTWSRKADFPGTVRMSAAGFSINNLGFVGTGYNAGDSYNDIYEYNPVSDTWTAKADFIGLERNGAIAFSVGSKGFLGMGNNTNSTSNFRDFYEYNPASDSWTQRAEFPLPYVVAASAYAGSNDGYTLGGYYYQYSGITHNPLNMLYRYNILSDEWSLAGTFCGLPRGYAGSFSINNDIYIGSGAQRNDASSSSMLNDFWKLSNGLTLRIENPDTYSDFSILPNPADRIIFFDDNLNNFEKDAVRIYNASGKLVSEKLLLRSENSIDISQLPAGIYFVELVSSSGKVLDGRFVKN